MNNTINTRTGAVTTTLSRTNGPSSSSSANSPFSPRQFSLKDRSFEQVKKDGKVPLADPRLSADPIFRPNPQSPISKNFFSFSVEAQLPSRDCFFRESMNKNIIEQMIKEISDNPALIEGTLQRIQQEEDRLMSSSPQEKFILTEVGSMEEILDIIYAKTFEVPLPIWNSCKELRDLIIHARYFTDENFVKSNVVKYIMLGLYVMQTLIPPTDKLSEYVHIESIIKEKCIHAPTIFADILKRIYAAPLPDLRADASSSISASILLETHSVPLPDFLACQRSLTPKSVAGQRSSTPVPTLYASQMPEFPANLRSPLSQFSENSTQTDPPITADKSEQSTPSKTITLEKGLSFITVMKILSQDPDIKELVIKDVSSIDLNGLLISENIKQITIESSTITEEHYRTLKQIFPQAQIHLIESSVSV